MKQKLKVVGEPEQKSKRTVLVSSLLQDYEVSTVEEQGGFVTLQDQGEYIQRMVADRVPDTATVLRTDTGALVTIPAVVGG